MRGRRTGIDSYENCLKLGNTLGAPNSRKVQNRKELRKKRLWKEISKRMPHCQFANQFGGSQDPLKNPGTKYWHNFRGTL